LYQCPFLLNSRVAFHTALAVRQASTLLKKTHAGRKYFASLDPADKPLLVLICCTLTAAPNPEAHKMYKTLRSLLPLAAVLGAGLPLPALAQTGQENRNLLDEVIVISSRLPTPMRQIGTSVSVITAADIEAHGNLGLSDILRQMPAIQVSSNGGAGKSTSLRIRGEEGFRTLSIMDGLRLSDPSGTQVSPQLEHLLSSGVNRVEILRGPQGLSYGADAGGVVNISTRSGVEGMQANIDAQGGKFGTHQVSGNLAGGKDRADFFVSGARFETTGFNTFAADTVFQDKDGYENSTLHLRGAVNLVEGWRVEAVHRYVDGESRIDNCFSPTNDGHDCVGLYELHASRLALSYTGNNFSHSVSYNSTRTDRDNLSSGISSFGTKGELNRLEYIGSVTNLPGFNLVFGADLEEALNNGTGRDNTGLYLEYLSDFSEVLYLTAGVRHDDNDDFGSNTSYRVSGAYLLDLSNDATLKFKSSYGSGFRAPSPYEIAYNKGPFASPPAAGTALNQESSEGWEAGIEYVYGSTLRLEAVYFDQQVEDAIEFDPVNWSGYLQILGTSSSEGIELSGEWNIGESWRLSSNYTHNRTERPNGLQRRRRPENLFNTGVSWYGMAQRLSLSAFLRMSRDSIDEAAGRIVPMDDFGVLDLSAGYKFSASFQLYGRIENALDEKYQEITGYNTAERAAYIGFRFNYAGL
jgi:vitamin B12 transporter